MPGIEISQSLSSHTQTSSRSFPRAGDGGRIPGMKADLSAPVGPVELQAFACRMGRVSVPILWLAMEMMIQT